MKRWRRGSTLGKGFERHSFRLLLLIPWLILAGCRTESDGAWLFDVLNDGFRGQLADAPWASSSQLPVPERFERIARASSVFSSDDRFRGLIRGYRGRFEGAKALLRRQASHGDWRSYNDLAVLLLEEANVEQEPLALVEALEAVESARSIAPKEPVVKFNHALVARALGLVRVAEQARDDLLAGNLLSDVKARAVEAIEDRPPYNSLEAWRLEAKGLLEQELSLERCRRLADRYPYRLRLLAERELTGQWSRAVLAADSQAEERSLASGLTIGQALSDRGEFVVLDIFRQLQQVSDSENALLVARAVHKFAQGVESFESGDYAAAKSHLAVKSDLDVHGVSALSELANYYDIYSRMQSRDYLEIAKERLGEAQRRVDEQRYPSLSGRVHWRLGVAYGIGGDSARATRHFSDGQVLLARTSGPELQAIGDMLLAEEYGDIRDTRRAWVHRLKALRGLAESGEVHQLQASLHHAARELSFVGRFSTSEPFLEEMELLVRESQDPQLELYFRLGRAECRAMANQTEAGLADLERAEDLMRSHGVRKDLSGYLENQRVLMQLETSPDEALAAVGRMLEHFETSQDYYQLIPGIEARSRALGALGRMKEQEEDLRRLLFLIEEERATVGDRSSLLAFQKAQDAFDTLRLLLTAEGRFEEALEVEEQRRARYLADARGLPASKEVHPLLDRVPEGTTVLYYSQIGRELEVWVLTHRSRRRLTIDATGLEAQIDRFTNGLKGGLQDDELHKEARNLYDRLLGPTDVDFESLVRLVISPQGSLDNLPFGALLSPDNRLLLEAVPVAFVPSLRLFLNAKARQKEGEVVIVGVPNLQGELPDLDPLPGALREATLVAGAYPAARLVVAERATLESSASLLESAAVFHFAGHAQAEEDPFRSSLRLHPSARSDGRLTLEMLRRLQFPPGTVVLSACSTMAGARLRGEGRLGLGAYVFGLGSTAVIASRWQVQDRALPELMERLHKALASGATASSAFREAVLFLRTEYGLPAAIWAPFRVLEVAETRSTVKGAVGEETI